MIRERIDKIVIQISGLNSEEKERYFKTLDRIFTNCCDYTGNQVKISALMDLGISKAMDLEKENTELLGDLQTDINIINNLCAAKGIEKLTESLPEDFAGEIVQEYFNNRRR